MNIFETLIKTYEFNRSRTLALLDAAIKENDAAQVLGWRPGPGRAHIAWQFMHVAITEELFATERLAPPKRPAWNDLVPRFKGGSTPDDDIPSVEQIRTVLEQSRAHLLDTVRSFKEADLAKKPEAFAARGWSVHDALNVLAWHEPHHQGQAHITLNLYRAQKP